ncbi:MAG: zinc ABC transporter substrate-binding protein [Deltaproteobacteria bacterium]|nr:zinc ABC transporter substrate-binding protein [Deltaproteobacteria bacterium]
MMKILCLFLWSAFICAAPVKVVTTLPVLKSITEEIGGKLVSVQSLAEPTQDAHFVQPKPTFMKKVRHAQLFIEVGMDLELWAQKVVDSAGNPKVQQAQAGRVMASAGVEPLEVPAVLSREYGDIHPYGNPHIWLDPVRVKKMAENIALALGNIDPKHEESYEKNLKAFKEKIDKELVVWEKKAKAIKDKQILTYHRSWSYFAKRFGFDVVGYVEVKPGIPPTPRHRDAIIKLVKREKVKTILMELFYDPTAPDYIAKKTGAKVVQVPIDVGAVPEAKDYFSLITYILDKLAS